MTIQTPASAATPKQRTSPFMTAAAGALLALIAAAALGAWQASRDGGRTSGAQRAAALPVPTSAQRVAGPVIDTAPTYYLVASRAQAAALQAGLDEAEALRVTVREPLLAERVEQLESAEVEAEFLQAMHVLDSTRGTISLPPMRVIDLR